MGPIDLPEVRAEVLEALRALSNPEHQSAKWGTYDPGVAYCDDLDMNVHTLYDDSQVLANPELAVPSVLHQSEVPALRELDAVLGQMIRDLGDRPDADYLADRRWSAVIQTARAALAAMQASDEAGLT